MVEQSPVKTTARGSTPLPRAIMVDVVEQKHAWL